MASEVFNFIKEVAIVEPNGKYYSRKIEVDAYNVFVWFDKEDKVLVNDKQEPDLIKPLSEVLRGLQLSSTLSDEKISQLFVSVQQILDGYVKKGDIDDIDLTPYATNAGVEEKLNKIQETINAAIETFREEQDKLSEKIAALTDRADAADDKFDAIDSQFETVATIAELDEVKKSVGDGKKKVADAITEKGVTTATDSTFDTLAGNIALLQTTAETNDATATADDILWGKTAYSKGVKIEGNIETKDAETFLPSREDQMIAGRTYLIGDQTIVGDTNLRSGNIKEGVSIFNVEGTLNAKDFTQDTDATPADLVANKTAYSKGEKISGTIPVIENENKDVTKEELEGSAAAVTITLEAGYYKNAPTVTIPKNMLLDTLDIAPEKIIVGQTINNIRGTATSDANASASSILKGNSAYVNGSKIEGTIPIVQPTLRDIHVIEGTEKTVKDLLILSDPDKTFIGPIRSEDTNDDRYVGFPIEPNTYYEGVDYIVHSEPDLFTDNIKAGKTIFGIQGTKTVIDTSAIEGSTANDIATGTIAYVNGEEVKGNVPSITNDQNSKSVTEEENSLSIEIPEGVYRRDYDKKYTEAEEAEGISAVNKVNIPYSQMQEQIPSFKPENIVNGRKVMGLTGTGGLEILSAAYPGGGNKYVIEQALIINTTNANVKIQHPEDVYGFIMFNDGSNTGNRFDYFIPRINRTSFPPDSVTEGPWSTQYSGVLGPITYSPSPFIKIIYPRYYIDSDKVDGRWISEVKQDYKHYEKNNGINLETGEYSICPLRDITLWLPGAYQYEDGDWSYNSAKKVNITFDANGIHFRRVEGEDQYDSRGIMQTIWFLCKPKECVIR